MEFTKLRHCHYYMTLSSCCCIYSLHTYIWMHAIQVEHKHKRMTHKKTETVGNGERERERERERGREGGRERERKRKKERKKERKRKRERERERKRERKKHTQIDKQRYRHNERERQTEIEEDMVISIYRPGKWNIHFKATRAGEGRRKWIRKKEGNRDRLAGLLLT